MTHTSGLCKLLEDEVTNQFMDKNELFQEKKLSDNDIVNYLCKLFEDEVTNQLMAKNELIQEKKLSNIDIVTHTSALC